MSPTFDSGAAFESPDSSYQSEYYDISVSYGLSGSGSQRRSTAVLLKASVRALRNLSTVEASLASTTPALFINAGQHYENASFDNSTVSFNVDEYLIGELGPKSNFEYSLRVLLTLLYSLILFTGIVGNVLTIYVVVRNRVMHTTTNFYILNLSIADLTTLIAGLPVEIFFLWQQYPWPFGFPFCVLRTGLIEFAAYNSVMTITAFSTERYIAICHPLKSASFKSKRSAMRVLAAIWMIAICFSLPFATLARVFAYRKYPNTGADIPESVVCTIPMEHQEIMRVAMQISAYLFFLIPMGYVTFLYVLIGLRIRRSLFGQLFRQGKRREGDAATQESMHAPSTNRGSALSTNSVKKGKNNRLSSGSHGEPADNRTKSQPYLPMTQLPNAARRSTAASKRASAPLYLVAVVIAFFICWCPFHLQRLLSIYLAFESFVEHQTFFNFLFNISGILFYVSPTINPILYSLLSIKFRIAFSESCSCKDERRSRLSRLASTGASISTKSVKGTDRMSTLRVKMNKTPADKNLLHQPELASSPDDSPELPYSLRSPSPTLISGACSAKTLKSALKNMPTTPALITTSKLTDESQSTRCEVSKQSICTQTTLTFPSSMMVDVALSFHVADDADSQRAVSELRELSGDEFDVSNVLIRDLEQPAQPMRTSQKFKGGHRALQQLGTNSLPRFYANPVPIVFPAVPLKPSTSSSSPRKRRAGTSSLVIDHKYKNFSLPNTPLGTTWFDSDAAAHFETPVGELTQSTATLIHSVSLNRTSAAEIVDRITELYDGDIEDEAALRVRIRQLSPEARRKAQVLLAYNADCASLNLDESLYMPLILFESAEAPGLEGEVVEIMDFTGMALEQNNAQPQLPPEYNTYLELGEEIAPIASPEFVSSASEMDTPNFNLSTSTSANSAFYCATGQLR